MADQLTHLEFRTSGFERLIEVMEELGEEVPRKVSRAAARAGGKAELDFARLNAPVGHGWQHKIRRYKDEDGKHRAELQAQGTYGITGLLLRGIQNAEENSGATNPNKAAFDVRMDKTLTPYYIRISNGKRYYYPASMEYGFRGKNSSQKVFSGYHFLKDSATEHSEFIHKQMEEKAIEGIEKVLNRR
jgi:hypothetical protein